MDVADRIFELVDGQYMEQQQFAADLGVSTTMVSAWRKKKSTSYMKRLPEIAEVLRTTVDYLARGPRRPEGETVEALRIPVLGSIPAGIPLEAIEDILDWEEVPAAWADGDRDYFGLVVRGDSMYPEYLPGDVVILRKDRTCESGDDCAVLVNGGEATLKRVYLHDGGGLELRPVNASYPPRTYTPAEVKGLPVQILGVVVELRRKKK